MCSALMRNMCLGFGIGTYLGSILFSSEPYEVVYGSIALGIFCVASAIFDATANNN